MLFLLISMAQAKNLSSAEFDDTAHTLAPGQKQIDVFRTSQFAISNELELKTSILGLLGGPNAGLEYALNEGKQGALSLGAYASTDWRFNSQSLSGGVNWTKGGPGTNRFNLSGAVSLATSKVDGVDERVNAVGTTAYASYHAVVSKQATWRFYGSVDPLNSARASSFVGGAGFDWNRGLGEAARISLGLQLIPTTQFVQALDAADADSSWVPVLLPLPSFDLWFTW